jgi:hypothetical protein
MKKNLWQLLMSGLVMLVVLCVPAVLRGQERGDSSLVLTVRPDKEAYIPGEAVQLTVSLTNRSETEVEVGVPDPQNGTLTLLLASSEQRFQRYVGPDWSLRGELSKPLIVLGAGEADTVQTTMLYHRLQPTSHLVEMYARPIREEELNDYFALNVAGEYSVKAVFYDCVSKTTIESEPLAIIVREPEGVDELVWDSIKDNGAAALLLHTGMLREQSDSARRAQELITVYPESTYARRLQALTANDQTERQ